MNWAMPENLSISIPLDEDGFMVMQCPRCNGFFKISSEDFKADDVEELWCPLCGLKNKDFFPKEVLKLAMAKAINQFMGDFEKELNKIGRAASPHSLVKMTITTEHTNEREPNILPLTDAYEDVMCGFCARHEKVKPLDKYLGAFCAFCGERI